MLLLSGHVSSLGSTQLCPSSCRYLVDGMSPVDAAGARTLLVTSPDRKAYKVGASKLLVVHQACLCIVTLQHVLWHLLPTVGL